MYALIVAAGTCLRHASLAGPGVSPQPTALEKLLNEVNDAASVGVVSGEAPEKIIAALNGGLTGCRMIMPETEKPRRIGPTTR